MNIGETNVSNISCRLHRSIFAKILYFTLTLLALAAAVIILYGLICKTPTWFSNVFGGIIDPFFVAVNRLGDLVSAIIDLVWFVFLSACFFCAAFCNKIALCENSLRVVSAPRLVGHVYKGDILSIRPLAPDEAIPWFRKMLCFVWRSKYIYRIECLHTTYYVACKAQNQMEQLTQELQNWQTKNAQTIEEWREEGETKPLFSIAGHKFSTGDVVMAAIWIITLGTFIKELASTIVFRLLLTIA